MTTATRTPPRWAVIAAHLVPLVTLPSGLWRIALVAGVPLGLRVADAEVGGEGWYIVGLSVISEALALLTLGLVRPWGERVLSWVPLLGGRRVAPWAAIGPASLGAVALAVIWGYAFRDFPDFGQVAFSHPAGHVLLIVCYLPVLLWAPLLGAVTWSYWRRRCR
ncbi:hypothetical protein VA596_06365 [Amycolatopsis sp., V23-08]|uniref:DUF3995 domain-containing protein n=1 Tax=Amycolatopsis heterodermiae TaxID=3110235 RepID=A0ABU5R067_9PSEU|nr:hypothetical protein [Amycolatopsis sp., V23-08]MEA5359155.1 hypothetical protein [Amycolatopsis sp., V23-08]